jgi:hypothetical protein
MTVNPHPFVLTTMAAQHRADLHAWADHYRLGRLAHRGEVHRLPWPDLAAIVAIAVALTLLAAGSAKAEPSPRQDGLAFMRAEGRAVTRIQDERRLDLSAAQQIGAARR